MKEYYGDKKVEHYSELTSYYPPCVGFYTETHINCSFLLYFSSDQSLWQIIHDPANN